MTGKKLIIMAVTLIVLVTVAVIQKKNTGLSKPAEKKNDTTLLEGIDLNSITSVEIINGSNNVVITKKDGKWVIPSLYNYPADFNKLAGVIQRTSQLKLGSPVPVGNIDKAEFGLDDNTRHIILKADKKEIITIDVGAGRNASKTAGWANQHFIKIKGNDAIYLVDNDFQAFSDDAGNWIKKEIFNVNSSDIVAVNTENIKLKLNGTDWQLEDLKDNEELITSEADKLRSALQYLNCITIADNTKTDKELGFDSPTSYTATTKDGLVYSVKTGKTGDSGRYARFTVEYNKPSKPSAPDKDADDDKKAAYEKELEQYQTAVAAGKEKADKLNSSLNGWTYVLNNYNAERFIISRDKLVKEKEPPKEKKADTEKPQD
jgi:hypothetical protein